MRNAHVSGHEFPLENCCPIRLEKISRDGLGSREEIRLMPNMRNTHGSGGNIYIPTQTPTVVEHVLYWYWIYIYIPTQTPAKPPRNIYIYEFQRLLEYGSLRYTAPSHAPSRG